MTDQWRDVRLPSELCAAAEQKFAERFGNVEELLSFVLRELLHSDVGQLDQAEQDIIEKRLRDLGYI
jgi:hypothetical protein